MYCIFATFRKGCNKNKTFTMRELLLLIFFFGGYQTLSGREAEVWDIFETSWETAKTYDNPFTDIEVEVVFKKGDALWTVPAFWEGGGWWTVRFAPPEPGDYRYRVVCSDRENNDLNGEWISLSVSAYSGDNMLLKHGFLKVNSKGRYFEHADGTPFFWLGDTWWKNLCKRMTWTGFQELAADRRRKGFTVVQIVCGPYPDEGMLEPRWANEGGMPYKDVNLSIMNPEYFRYADRRLFHLAESGIVAAIVGGWGREQTGGESTIALAGAEAYKRHWRHLIARYGALPVVWIVGGETGDWQGPWTEVAEYLKKTDPYGHPLTFHSPGDPGKTLKDSEVFDFDMIALGHDGYHTARSTLDIMALCLARKPVRPALCGEACYEEHMQTNFHDMQRYLFWSLMLSGAAGHTYGAAGIWHGSVEDDPGIAPVYDHTTWREGMDFPGATQIGLGKKLLEEYPWWKFEQHPEWSDTTCFAAGIPGVVRFIYQPKQGIYNWNGPRILELEPGITYKAYYFDPATGRRFDIGKIIGHKNPDQEIRFPLPSPRDWVLVLDAVGGSGT
jgi:hypothetical protein